MKSVKEVSKKKIFAGLCIFLLVVIICSFVYTGRNYGNQARIASYLSACFTGEYKVADGDWQPYVKGEHIPADKGDVMLKGHFELYVPDTGEVICNAEEGVVLAFYFNHIGGEISEGGEEFSPFDAEFDIYGEDMCGEMYIGYECKGADEITIKLKNPHKFGNAGAVDDFLNNLNTYGGTDFERDMLNRGNTDRAWGFMLILFAFMILGIALFAMPVHIKDSNILWLIGFCIFSAGIYFMFNAHGVKFFSEIIKFNTRMLVGSMMIYMLMLTAIIAYYLNGKIRKTGAVFSLVSFVSVAVFMLMSAFAHKRIYDMLPIWVIIQGVICLGMITLLICHLIKGKKSEKIFTVLAMLPMISFIIDAVGTGAGLWQGAIVSEDVFILIFIVAFILILRIVPQNLNAGIRAKELEVEKAILKSELAESRIAILISQIQPHFIYNTLGTIEQLCITEPEAASKLVRNFSLYLRGNFSELDNVKPIRFSQEMNHVKHYTDIEQVRFPDITIQYDLRSVEFLLPALSVQPLVENAIKHGLMGLEKGGVVTISAYEADDYYVVEVTDDGVGFDINEGYDEVKHVGIKNIRGRIEEMCNGTLVIESKIGSGTKATLKIPKEATEDDSNNG